MDHAVSEGKLLDAEMSLVAAVLIKPSSFWRLTLVEGLQASKVAA
jgi:hypothetical protein